MAKNGKEIHGLNYLTANRFYVEIEDFRYISACFQECSGLSVKVNYDTFFEGGVNNQQRIIMGHTQFSEVILKRGITNDLVFWGWANRMLTQLESINKDLSERERHQLNPQRRNVNILLFNQAGQTIQCWTLIGAVPVAWNASPFQADSSTVAIEELTLAYEGIKVIVNLAPENLDAEKTQSTMGGGAIFHDKGRDTKAGGFFPSN
ncbi:MAG: phage tail protein [Phormidium sp.]